MQLHPHTPEVKLSAMSFQIADVLKLIWPSASIVFAAWDLYGVSPAAVRCGG
jgi:hypothetical protein